MVAKPLVLARQTFATLSEAKAHIRQILGRYALNNDLDPPDFELMSAVLERHPGAHIKVGCGVAWMFVAPDNWGHRCFWLRRLDGTIDDFSFTKCLTAPPVFADFRAACRNEIHPQIAAYKRDRFASGTGRCDLTGVALGIGSCDADHVQPQTFLALVHAFSCERGIDPTTEPTDAAEAGNTEKHLVRVETRDAWIDFHRANAKLRLLAPEVHRRLPRR